MKHKLSILAAALLMMPVATYGFFNELEGLQTELIAWQAEHSTDFSDLLETINKMSPTPFSDVDDTEWYHPYVVALSSWGLVSGFKDANGKLTGRFEPNRPVTLAEDLKIALEAAGVDKDACTGDVRHRQARDHWAKKYVACAEQLQISLFKNGQPDLNKPVTRSQTLAILSDAFQDPLLPIASQFTDTAGHPLEKYIANAKALGIITGDRNSDGTLTGTFRPDAEISRAEISKVVFGRLKIKAAKLISKR